MSAATATTPQTTMPTQPGLYPDVPATDYHRWPAANQSLLKVIRDKSPAHARQEMLCPAGPTAAMKLGTALHVAVLQPDEFDKHYACAPDVDRRTRAGKEAWAEFVLEHPEATLLKPDEWQQVVGMRDAVLAHPTAAAVLQGETELSALWVDSWTGVWCKARLDVLNRTMGAVGDIKTTTDASPRAFRRTIWNLGYHLQAAHYLRGVHALGADADLFAIVAVEKTPPFAVAVYQIEDEALVAGEGELGPLMETYAKCQETGVWPAYDEKAIRITLPPWAWGEVEERVGVDDY